MPEPIKIDWQQFIRNGYDKTSEVKSAARDLAQGAEKIPHDGNLFITERLKNNIPHFVVVCRCGNSRMLKHENGIRCHICGRFHTHNEFQKQSAEVKRLARQHNSKIITNPQPFLLQEEIRKFNLRKYVESNKRTGRGTASSGNRKGIKTV